jgi:hypothetical protein
VNRHLLPEEIDLLLDNEEGFGMAPLRTHLEACDQCRSSVEALARVVVQLEGLPHFRPAPLFADRLMAKVEVYQPWHVAARDFLGRLIPESSAGRVIMGGVGATAAAGVTAGLIWVGQRADAVLFVGSYGLQRAREGLVASAMDATTSLLGAGAADTLVRGGPLVLAAATGAAVLGVLGVAAAVRGIATANRRRD